MISAYPKEYELVMEDTVTLTDGLACSQSAVVEFSPRCSGNFIATFAKLQALGLIKIKTVKVKKVRDWIKP